MGIFRSEEIDIYKITIYKDTDWKAMNELGKLSNLHFIDLNREKQPFELTYTPQIKATEESDKRLAYIENIYRKFNLEMRPVKDMAQFDELIDTISKQTGTRGNMLMGSLNQDLKGTFEHIKNQQQTLTESLNIFKESVQKLAVMNKIRQLTGHQFISPGGSDIEYGRGGVLQSINPTETLITTKIAYMGGIIGNENINQLKRLVIRATRCQVFVHSFPLFLEPQDRLIDDNFDSKKSIYVMVYQEGSMIEDRIRRICNSFNGSFYNVTLDDLNQEHSNTYKAILHSKDVVRQTKQVFRQYLIEAQNRISDDVSVFKFYKMFMTKERMIYHHMNMLQQNNMVFQGLVWAPRYMKFDKLAINIAREKQLSGFQAEKGPRKIPGLTKPTLISLNEFTSIFQLIVNTYGIPNYREVNPAVFTAVSFPFLFGVMFGDIMHGAWLTIFAIYLIFASKEKGSLAESLAPARYFLLLMGIFAFFCGVIYNDFTSMATQLFGPGCYKTIPIEGKPGLTKGVPIDDDCIYPVGFDPIWFRSTGEIAFTNSFKMKTSVVYGVAQMTLGTVMKGFNALYFGNCIEFIFEVITQITLMMALFGFMDWLIVVKWLTDWSKVDAQPPSIITAMITMFIKFGEKEAPVKDKQPVGNFIGGDDDSVQTQLMQTLVLIALITVPLMLCVRPCWDSAMAKRKKRVEGEGRYQRLSGMQEEIQVLAKDVLHFEEHGDTFGAFFIHQMIETIEYVLGTISNTASYLRLWALSLAHGQLAKVFLDYTVRYGFESGNPLVLFFGFYVFIGTSFAVLMVMDLMEAVLHTLRLHWVEFQNKFFKGAGYLWKPYAFSKLLEIQDEV